MSRIIHYERLIESQGSSLSALSPAASGLREPLNSRNINPLYPAHLYRKVGERLLDSPGAAWLFYRRKQITNLIEQAMSSAPRASTKHNSSSPARHNYEFKVNFLIIGAQKCGTSALVHFLMQHPEIHMARKKEVHFFNSLQYPEQASPEEIRSMYHAHFDPPGKRTIIGEATPAYLFLPFVPGRIKRYNPDMKLICLLRDPVDRAVSQYRMERARGTEKRSFWGSIVREKIAYTGRSDDYSLLNKDEPVRRFCYLERGMYTRQIDNYLKYFPSAQILSLRTSDLQQHHQKVLTLVYEFLGVKDMDCIPDQEMVFQTKNDQDGDIPAKWLLKLYFRRELKRIDKLSC